MGFNIMQINIKHWINNRYLFMTEATNYNPNIILLNETSMNPEATIKERGYNAITSSQGQYSGTAILIKNNI